MNGILTLHLLLALQLPPQSNLDLWSLDAARVFTFQKTSADQEGNPQTSVSVVSLPNPFTFNPARILKLDGQPLTVGEVLTDVAQSGQLPSIAESLRGSYTRLALVQGVLAAGAGAATILGVGILIPGVLLSLKAWAPHMWLPFHPVERGEWLGLLWPLAIAGFGAAAVIPAAAILAFSGRLALRAGKAAMLATPDNVSQGTEWPVGPAADAVQEHNRRLLEGRQRAPVKPLPEDEAPAVIPS